MKIRSNYVSNSSSSSFIIAYDEKFFGDLEKIFKQHYLGDSKIYPYEETDKFFTYYDYDKDAEFINDIREAMNKAESEGKAVRYISLDYDHIYLIDVLKQINDNNGADKLKIIYDGGDN